MISILSLLLFAATDPPATLGQESLICDAELVIRLKMRNGGFEENVQRPQLSFFLSAAVVSTYMRDGESVLTSKNSLGLQCSEHTNGSILCVGGTPFSQSAMTARFEVRPDKTFLFHEIGITSSDVRTGSEAIDKITVGRCSKNGEQSALAAKRMQRPSTSGRNQPFGHPGVD